MAWPVDTDPLAFLEALGWFLSKVPLVKAAWNKLSAESRRKAFTVADVAQADLVHDAMKAIDRAINHGTTLEEFKREIGPKLLAAWSGKVKSPAWRLETIYRTNIQSAYGAGRYKQVMDPDIVKVRPFLMFDAVLDNRVTNICRDLDNTVLPATDSFWDTHTPPLHFNCRSALRSLRRKRAEEKGITKAAPGVAAADGFGLRPGEDEWQPDFAKYPPPLRSELERKTRRG